MIIGSGQLAQAFMPFDRESVCYFASGVSNSNCTDPAQFKREKNLLRYALQDCVDKKFIYFSSCALSAPEYPKNAYYQHKQHMEEIIQEQAKDFLIFRIPQLFGELKHHNTLINYFYESILEGREFKVYNCAYRYVIEINDVVTLVKAYVDHDYTNKILNLANPYRYRIEEIVQIFESILNKKAYYQLVEKQDHYELDLKDLILFAESNKVDIFFEKNYLKNKLLNNIDLNIK